MKPSAFWPVSTSEALGSDRSGQLHFRMEAHYPVYQYHYGMTKNARNKIADKRWRLHKSIKEATHKVKMRGGTEDEIKKLSGGIHDYDGGGGGAKYDALKSRLENLINRTDAQMSSVTAHIAVLDSDIPQYTRSRAYQQLKFACPGASGLSAWDAYETGVDVDVEYGRRGNGVDTVSAWASCRASANAPSTTRTTSRPAVRSSAVG